MRPTAPIQIEVWVIEDRKIYVRNAEAVLCDLKRNMSEIALTWTLIDTWMESGPTNQRNKMLGAKLPQVIILDLDLGCSTGMKEWEWLTEKKVLPRSPYWLIWSHTPSGSAVDVLVSNITGADEDVMVTRSKASSELKAALEGLVRRTIEDAGVIS